MSKLLIEGDFYIPVQQSLAAALGNSKKAVILQQIYYWMKTYEESTDETERKKHFRDGHWWVFNTLEKWGDQFKYIMGQRMMEKYLKELIEDGYLLTANYNKYGYDRTKWYSVDVDKVRNTVQTHASSHSAITAECNPQPLRNGFRNNCGDDTIEYTNNTSKNGILVSDSVKEESEQSEPLIDKKYGIPENLGLIGEDRKQIWIDAIQYHIERQIGWSRKKHRKHKPEYWREHITESDEMLEFDRRVELSTEWTHRIIDYYFTVVKPRGDGEFAALWNKKMLMGILNKLCGGSKYDYYKAGMIENEPEILEESYAKVESNILEFV